MITALVIFIIGSVANLIVVQQAKRRVDIGFMEYFRVGALITVITLAIGILVLALEVRIAHGAEDAAGKNEKRPVSAAISYPGTAAPRTYDIVLVCDTDESRTRGLQGFRRLTISEAALFVFDPPQAVTFWMGTVAYPIDIVFISPAKEVIRLYRNAKPGSKALYPSGGKAAWVLETAAGSGIRVGDGVSFE